MSGAGLVTLGVPESLMDVFQARVTEEMCLPLPDSGDGTLSSKAVDSITDFLKNRADALAIGPGIGYSDETKALIQRRVAKADVPTVMDADALNCLEKKTGILKKAKAPLVLTPHPGEFARMSGQRIEDVEGKRIDTALAFSRESGATLVLKGVPTVVAEPDGETFINTTGNPSMAKAGAGDVLTGMVASFIGQGLSPPDAARLGVYVHGMAGDLAASEFGLLSVLASDIIGAIPEAFKSLRRS
jgi:NAD(P)H-hydrate epimerase